MIRGKSILELHEPVLVEKVLKALKVKKLALSKNASFIDATVGLGGHTIEIVRLGGRVLGIEADKNSLEIALMRLKKACPPTFSSHERGSFTLVYGNFKDIDLITHKNGFDEVDGILFDLGVSSYQLTNKSRGFSFQNKLAPLDMRIDRGNQRVTATDLLRLLNIKQLTELFARVLSRNQAQKVARKVVEVRGEKPITTVGDFIKIIGENKLKKPGLHAATLAFLALRMAVNSELENLMEALPKAYDLLGKDGRLVFISFHSGEDRVVKDFFKQKDSDGVAQVLTKKPIVPSDIEIVKNPRARSAKMRVLQKL